jgi:signal peptidase II
MPWHESPMTRTQEIRDNRNISDVHRIHRDDSMVTQIGARLVLAIAIALTISCDRATKHLAATTLAGASGRSFLADTVRLEYVENAGGFLSLGADLPPAVRTGFFTIGTGVALVVAVAGAIVFRWTGWPLVGLSLFVAGGASNWVDRVVRGSVIDFINVGYGPLRTGIFNVADVAIMLGVGIVVMAELRRNQATALDGSKPTQHDAGLD